MKSTYLGFLGLWLGLAACGGRAEIEDGGGGSGASDGGAGASSGEHVVCTSPTAKILAESPGAGDLRVDGETIFWIVEDGIWSMPVTGGAPVQLVVGQQPPRALAVDAEFVYFTTNEPGSGHGALSRVPRGGGVVTELYSDDFVELGAVALTDDDVYFADRWGWSEDDDRAGLVRVPKAGGEDTWLLNEESGLGPLVIQDGIAYFYDAGRMSDFGAGELRSVDLESGVRTTLTKGPVVATDYLPPLRTLIVSDGSVVWAEHAPGHDTLRRARTNGDDLETLAFTETGRWIAAVGGDSAHVIWVDEALDEGTGAILRSVSPASKSTLLDGVYGVQALAAVPGHLLWSEVPGEVRDACLADP